MTEKIYCPKFVAALLPTLPLSTPYSDSLAKKLDDWMACRKEECGFFSKKHGICSIVALADKPPLTVALDIPADGSEVEGWCNK